MHLVQDLEPAGVGARDLQECLLLQLKHKTPSDSITLAINVIEQQFDAFTKKNITINCCKSLTFPITTTRKAIDEIEKLNPKPGGSFDGNQKAVEHIVPDFTIRIIDGELELSLNGRNAPELRFKDYQEMLQSYKDTSEKIEFAKRCSAIYQTKIRFCKMVY